MKKLIVFGALACALSISAQAASLAKTCNPEESTAKMVMRARQTGAPISKVMALVDNSELVKIRGVLRAMVILAYNEPQAYSNEDKKRAATEFGNQVYMYCYQSYRKAHKGQ